MNKSETKIFLTWFAPNSDKSIGQEEVVGLTTRKIRKWFYLPKDEIVADCYIVRASQKIHLDPLVKHVIDLNKYDYFVEPCEFVYGKGDSNVQRLH